VTQRDTFRVCWIKEVSQTSTNGSEMAKYDTNKVCDLIGNGITRQAARRYVKQNRIKGAYQRTKNAKVWFTPSGVHEVWQVWAEYMDLDPEKDMPVALRKMKLNGAKEQKLEAPSDRLAVTIILPPGAHLQIVQQG
jgi:hypothetical protein